MLHSLVTWLTCNHITRRGAHRLNRVVDLYFTSPEYPKPANKTTTYVDITIKTGNQPQSSVTDRSLLYYVTS